MNLYHILLVGVNGSVFFRPHLNVQDENNPFVEIMRSHPSISQERWRMIQAEVSENKRSCKYLFKCEGRLCEMPQTLEFPTVLSEHLYARLCSSNEDWTRHNGDTVWRWRIISGDRDYGGNVCNVSIKRISQNEIEVERRAYNLDRNGFWYEDGDYVETIAIARQKDY